MANSRIQLNDTVITACTKMSEGNPGALTVVTQMIKSGGDIDPDGFMGGFGAVLSLDTHRIYGCRIWMLFKDVCGQDLCVMIAILRAVQLGLLRESLLHTAIDNRGQGIDVAALVAEVEEQLPNFQRAPETTVAIGN
jgi:hypothetical protein